MGGGGSTGGLLESGIALSRCAVARRNSSTSTEEAKPGEYAGLSFIRLWRRAAGFLRWFTGLQSGIFDARLTSFFRVALGAARELNLTAATTSHGLIGGPGMLAALVACFG